MHTRRKILEEVNLIELQGNVDCENRGRNIYTVLANYVFFLNVTTGGKYSNQLLSNG